jgi:plasmid maintenance system antidote protein VapI
MADIEHSADCDSGPGGRGRGRCDCGAEVAVTRRDDNGGRCRVCGEWRGPDGCCEGSTLAVTRHGFDPDWVISPGETLREWREENGLGPQAAATTCGRMAIAGYERIEAGKRRITKPIAEALAHGTGIPASLWLNLERAYRDGLARGKIDAS